MAYLPPSMVGVKPSNIAAVKQVLVMAPSRENEDRPLGNLPGLAELPLWNRLNKYRGVNKQGFWVFKV